MVLSTDPKLLYNTQVNHRHRPMRYNPATDRALYTIDEIAEQCRNAILRADARREEQEIYAQVLEFARWENDVLIAA